MRYLPLHCNFLRNTILSIQILNTYNYNSGFSYFSIVGEKLFAVFGVLKFACDEISLSLNTDDHRDLYFEDLIFSKSFFNCQW